MGWAEMLLRTRLAPTPPPPWKSSWVTVPTGHREASCFTLWGLPRLS